MLNMVEVRTEKGDLLNLPIADISQGYAITDIEGLDPVKATIISSSFALMDGAQYQSARTEPRNILLKMNLEPDYVDNDVSSLRHRLYSFLMPKSRVRLRFISDDGQIREIFGRVESFDSNMFSREPGVVVSFICHQPYFYDPEPMIIEGTTTPGFGFTSFEYDGSVATGFKFRLLANRSVPDGFAIEIQYSTSSTQFLTYSGEILNGDILQINTQPGAKGATLFRGAGESSALFGITPQSTWLNLTPGDLAIRVYIFGDPVPYTLEYTKMFGGI